MYIFLFFLWAVREKIGAIATPDYIQNAPGLPKTRSGECVYVYVSVRVSWSKPKVVTPPPFVYVCAPCRQDHAARPSQDRLRRARPGRRVHAGRLVGGGRTLPEPVLHGGVTEGGGGAATLTPPRPTPALP